MTDIACCYGVGFDSNKYGYPKTKNRVKVKPYAVWRDMIKRCFHQPYKDVHKSYQNVTCCEEWLDYQEFAKWFESNYKEGFELDKDILQGSEEIYSPNTCAFVPRALNLFKTNIKGKSDVGVCHRDNTHTAYCNNGEGKTLNLGSRVSRAEALYLYKNFKEGLAKDLADRYFESGDIDKRVRDALYSFTVN